MRQIWLVGPLQEFRQDVWAKVDQNELCINRPGLSVRLELDAMRPISEMKLLQADARKHLCTRRLANAFEFIYEMAHAANRNLPFARAIADKVINEATILQQ